MTASSEERVPRPLGQALHADKPNKVLHLDFCFLEKSATGETYVHIIKDNQSSYTWLYPFEAADTDTAAEALMDWMAALGICKQWVSDQGTHFTNDVMRTLRENRHIAHHFTLPYCSWSNGTVEVVCRELIWTTKALLSEFKLSYRKWPLVLPLVQSALNSHKHARLGHRAPITVFAGLPCHTTLGSIKTPDGERMKFMKPDDMCAYQQMKILKLANALDKMHKDAADGSRKERKRRVTEHNAKTGVKPCNFVTGDLVLRGVVRRTGSKLQIHWFGPMRVTSCFSDYLFELQDLRSLTRNTVHGSKVRFFSNKDFQITE